MSLALVHVHVPEKRLKSSPVMFGLWTAEVSHEVQAPDVTDDTECLHGYI